MTDSNLDENIMAEGETRTAGFWIRVGAAILDSLILFPLSALYLLILLGINSFLISLGGLLIAIAYKPLLEYKYGQTLGKMALGIKVTTESGGQIGLGQSFVRYLPWMVGNIISLVMIVMLYSDLDLSSLDGFAALSMKMYSPHTSNLNTISTLLVAAAGISVAADKENRGIHDKLAKTVCVYTND